MTHILLLLLLLAPRPVPLPRPRQTAWRLRRRSMQRRLSLWQSRSALACALCARCQSRPGRSPYRPSCRRPGLRALARGGASARCARGATPRASSSCATGATRRTTRSVCGPLFRECQRGTGSAPSVAQARTGRRRRGWLWRVAAGLRGRLSQCWTATTATTAEARASEGDACRRTRRGSRSPVSGLPALPAATARGLDAALRVGPRQSKYGGIECPRCDGSRGGGGVFLLPANHCASTMTTTTMRRRRRKWRPTPHTTADLSGMLRVEPNTPLPRRSRPCGRRPPSPARLPEAVAAPPARWAASAWRRSGGGPLGSRAMWLAGGQSRPRGGSVWGLLGGLGLCLWLGPAARRRAGRLGWRARAGRRGTRREAELGLDAGGAEVALSSQTRREDLRWG